jgi:hypothetical protein
LAVEGIVDFGFTADFIFGGLINLAPDPYSDLFKAISVVLVKLVFLYVLYKNKLFLKI